METQDSALIALAAQVRDDHMDELLARIVLRAHALGGAYGDIPGDDLASAAGGLLQAAIRALTERRGLDDAEREQAAFIGERRARQGVPLDEVLRVIRLAGREALELMRDLAGPAGMDAATTISLTARLWDWMDEIAVEMTQAHRRVELAHARRDQQQRVSFVHALVSGALGPHRIEETAAGFGLDHAASHVVICARPAPEHPADALERLFLPSTWTVGLTALVDDDLVAVLPAAAPVPELPVAAGIGPAGPLAALPRSFRDAGRALETAVAFGLVGGRRLDELVLPAVVLAEESLGDVLVDRYITPVRALGPFGEDLLLSLRAYVDHELNVEAAARALHVHPNTLRHRLARFEETTGANLRRTEHLAELWWALAADARLHGVPAG